MNKGILIGVMLGVAGFTFLFNSCIGFAIDSPLKSIYFSSGGDMRGSMHILSVKAVDSTNALVCYEDASWHNEAVSVKEYLVPVSVLDDIKTIFNNNKLYRCENAPKSPFVILDGATHSYYFYFDKKSVRFSSTQNLSEADRTAIREIEKCTADACQKGKRLPGLVLEKDAEGNLPRRRVSTEGKTTIKVTGYKNQILTVCIGNGQNKDVTLSLNSKITLADNPDVIIFERNSKEKYKAAKNYNDEYELELNKRLEPGKYCLTLGGYSDVFEIK